MSNPSWNEKLSEEELHERMLRGRRVLSELQQVLTLTYARKPVAEIARQLGCSREKVDMYQKVLLYTWHERAWDTRRSHKAAG